MGVNKESLVRCVLNQRVECPKQCGLYDSVEYWQQEVANKLGITLEEYLSDLDRDKFLDDLRIQLSEIMDRMGLKGWCLKRHETDILEERPLLRKWRKIVGDDTD